MTTTGRVVQQQERPPPTTCRTVVDGGHSPVLRPDPGSPLMFDFRFAGDDELTTISELTITPRP